MTQQVAVADLADRFAIDEHVNLPILKVVRRVALQHDGRFRSDARVSRRISIQLPCAVEVFPREFCDVRGVRGNSHYVEARSVEPLLLFSR